MLELCIEVLPLVWDGYACHFRVLAAHGQEEEGQEVAQQRRSQGKLGCSHNAQLELLHDHAPREHPQGDGGDVYDALEPAGTCEKYNLKSPIYHQAEMNSFWWYNMLIQADVYLLSPSLYFFQQQKWMVFHQLSINSQLNHTIPFLTIPSAFYILFYMQ